MGSEILQVLSYLGEPLTVCGSPEEPAFLMNEVGKILDIKNSRSNYLRLEDYMKPVVAICNGQRSDAQFINEAGLYKVVFSSRVEKAKSFQKWVFTDVLPAIRRTGTYTQETPTKQLNDLHVQLKTLQNELQETKQENESLTDIAVELDDKIGIKKAKCKALKKRRFLVSGDLITVSDRLVEIDLITRAELEYIQLHRTAVVNGRIIKFPHPDAGKFNQKLCMISKFLSIHRRDELGRNPDIAKGCRKNLYTLADWETYGDNILKDFLEEHPFDEWNIDWDWFSTLPEFTDSNKEVDEFP